MKSMCDVAERLKNIGRQEGFQAGRSEGRLEGRSEGRSEERTVSYTHLTLPTNSRV